MIDLLMSALEPENLDFVTHHLTAAVNAKFSGFFVK